MADYTFKTEDALTVEQGATEYGAAMRHTFAIVCSSCKFPFTLILSKVGSRDEVSCPMCLLKVDVERVA